MRFPRAAESSIASRSRVIRSIMGEQAKVVE
jgi:hypothetical protein